MGVKLETMVEPDAYRQKIYEIGMSLLYRLMRPWLHADFMFKLSGRKAMLDAILNPVHDFTKNIINQRRVLFHEKRHEFPDMLNENV
jgi:cytochrome P450 family 4